MPKLRDLPPCPDVPAERSSQRTTREYRISVVTPLFGGGVAVARTMATEEVAGSQ